ncbi:hypothetical protein QLX08_009561 [Tetragonisca angustula]|uniref:Uncharacterized protein n=1 Tax=Tetragonisca angustula TaxID=166442 RepID=A0AAW0ZFQ0_9HYME
MGTSCFGVLVVTRAIGNWEMRDCTGTWAFRRHGAGRETGKDDEVRRNDTFGGEEKVNERCLADNRRVSSHLKEKTCRRLKRATRSGWKRCNIKSKTSHGYGKTWPEWLEKRGCALSRNDKTGV